MNTIEKNPVRPDEIEKFRASIDALCNSAWRASGYTYAAGVRVEASLGARYARLFRYEVNDDGNPWCSSRNAHCFVDLTNGDILKAAGWKAPDRKNPRGNIRDLNPLAGVTEYGVNRLRG